MTTRLLRAPLVLVVLNGRATEPDPILRLIRLHLGRSAGWPWPLQVLGPILLAAVIWLASYPLLTYAGVLNASSTTHVIEQGLMVGSGLVFTLKFLLPPVLVLYLLASYVYLGNSPVWDFVSATARSALAPLSPLPLRIAKLDLAPIAGLLLVLLLLHWLPELILTKHLILWPQ